MMEKTATQLLTELHVASPASYPFGDYATDYERR